MLDVFTIFNGIPLPPQGRQKGFKGEALPDGGVNVLPHKAGDGASARFLRLPLSVVFSSALRLNDRQAVFTADGVGGLPQRAEITLKIAPVLLPVHEGDGIEHDMAMQMFLIRMGGDDRLVAVPQQAAGKLHPGLVGFLRRHFAGGIGVDDVIALDAAPLVPAALGSLHFRTGGFRAAVDPRYQMARLGRLHAVVQSAGEGCFFLVQRVVQTVVQPPVDDDDLVVGHYSASFTSRKA